MRQQWKRLLWSFFISLALVLLLSGSADLTPAFFYLGLIAAPGMLGAAIFFRHGVHGDWPELYLAVAIIIDAALYTWPILLVWRLLAGQPKSNASPGEAAMNETEKELEVQRLLHENDSRK
jgi:hypothetical protein